VKTQSRTYECLGEGRQGLGSEEREFDGLAGTMNEIRAKTTYAGILRVKL
jgi:hypothetical protein